MVKKGTFPDYKLHQLVVVLLLVINTVLIGWTYYSFRVSFPSNATRLSYKQEVARDLTEYNQRLALELNVLNRTAVKEALASFNYDVEVSSSSDELTQVILNQGRRVQEIILREAEAKLLDEILAVINQDENVRQTTEKDHLSLRIEDEEVSTVPEGFLHYSTIFRIKQILPDDRYTPQQSVEFEIMDGVGRLAVPYNPVEHLQTLTDELDSLRLKLHELRVSSGLAEMSGPGIGIRLYDEAGGTSTTSIIHDADIRDVVNELFGSGAQGISVGGQRLTVASSIRCSGSLVKVNDKLITVNPVVIEAVGNPDLLISGLDIIRTNMELKRGLRFDIIRLDSVKLPAYVRSVQ
ncbi:MAG: DUF881 domain-containing protein [Bacillota bacterium]